MFMVAFIDRESTTKFIQHVEERYQAVTGIESEFMRCRRQLESAYYT